MEDREIKGLEKALERLESQLSGLRGEILGLSATGNEAQANDAAPALRGRCNDLALRAELTWDDDRRREAEALGSQIGRRPGEVVEALRRTPQGCSWLMTRWAMLAHSADGLGWKQQTRDASRERSHPAEWCR